MQYGPAPFSIYFHSFPSRELPRTPEKSRRAKFQRPSYMQGLCRGEGGDPPSWVQPTPKPAHARYLEAEIRGPRAAQTGKRAEEKRAPSRRETRIPGRLPLSRPAHPASGRLPFTRLSLAALAPLGNDRGSHRNRTLFRPTMNSDVLFFKK